MNPNELNDRGCQNRNVGMIAEATRRELTADDLRKSAVSIACELWTVAMKASVLFFLIMLASVLITAKLLGRW